VPINAAIVVLNLLLQQSPAAPTFQSTTRTVSLNVIAVDKAGLPVADLTRGDFTITDNGQPRAITHFSLEMSAGAINPSAPSGNSGQVPTATRPHVMLLQ
jgi:hypothetical protein